MLKVVIPLMFLMVAIPAYSEILSPAAQLKAGIMIQDVQCDYEKTLLASPNGRPACTSFETAERLAQRGWNIIRTFDDMRPSDGNQTNSVMSNIPDDITSRNGTESSGMIHDETNQTQSNIISNGKEIDEMPVKDEYYDFIKTTTYGNITSQHNGMYLVNNNHITLAGIEPLPNPDGFWFPTTIVNYERAMQQIADGIDDRVILEIINPDLAHKQGAKYETEKGNKIRAGRSAIIFTISGHDGLSQGSLDYKDDLFDLDKQAKYSAERGLANDRDAAIRNFVEKTGLPDVRKIVHGDIAATVYLNNPPSTGKMKFDFWSNNHIEITVSPWTQNLDLPKNLGQYEMSKRIHQFALDNAHVFDPKRCKFTPYDEPYRSYAGVERIQAGVPIHSMRVGTCFNSDYPDHQPLQAVYMEGITGEIGWFDSQAPLVEDWLDRIDIPESAKVRDCTIYWGNDRC